MLSVLDHLVKYFYVVVGEVEEDQAAKATKSPLLNSADVAAMQWQVSQVGSVFESTCWNLLEVITSKIQFDCDLKGERDKKQIF